MNPRKRKATDMSHDETTKLDAAIVTAAEKVVTTADHLARMRARIGKFAAAALLEGKGSDPGVLADVEAARQSHETAIAAHEGLLAMQAEMKTRLTAGATARRWKETETLLNIDAAEGMAKIQRAADLAIEGHEQLHAALVRARTTIPVRQEYWPGTWHEKLEAYFLRYIGARSGFFRGRVMKSERDELLAGPDLNAMHRIAVAEVLAPHQSKSSKEAA